DVVEAIRSGLWAEQVERVRKENRIEERQSLKSQLSYWTPSGLFSYRANDRLIKHSGHIAVDLDGLGIRGATKAIQTAVADQYCRCAYRSASGAGARLVFQCPPCSAQVHKQVFESVAEHVRRH